MKKTQNAEKGYESALGMNYKDLTEKWHKYLKKEYWPDFKDRDPLEDMSEKLTDHKKQNNFYNVSPSLSPDGSMVAVLSDQNGYFDINILDAMTGEKIKKLIKGNRGVDFEELKWLQPGLSWSPDSKKIVFAAKAGKGDVLHVVEVETGKGEKYELDIEGVFSASWSPLGNEIAYVGQSGNSSDIYIFDLNSQISKKITDDIFSDSYPSWNKNGDEIVFVSDRGDYVDGKYVRSESGKTYTKELKNEFYELPLTSKKDIRDAVTSSKDGFMKWSSTTPYLRMQILYRLSEMIEGNKESYVELLMDHGLTKQKAIKDIDESIQNIVWFAGLADKWEQLAGNLNPVSEEYFNISHQNPIGVVFSLSGSNISLNDLLMSILPSITVGCSVISYSEENSVLALKFAEDINNSDFPSGSLNILSGKFENVLDDVSKHVEINLVALHKELDNDGLKAIEQNASESVKRVISQPSLEGISYIIHYL